MNKTLIKLIAAGLSLTLAVTVAVMATYAWFTLSTSPEVGGATVIIGGSNTIMLAPNISASVSVEGSELPMLVNYPGAFSDTLLFSAENGYDLSDVGGLAPVSTADGVNWIIPIYDAGEESRYLLDTSLSYANQTALDMSQKQAQGNYVFLDFWVYSPVADYRLRVSAGDEGEGSYLIGLPMPEEYDTDADGVYDSYQLVEGSVSAAASARVGFLTNLNNCSDQDLMAYENSADFHKGITRLKGSLYEQGTNLAQLVDSYENLFTIYEPNGTLHNGVQAANDTYQITRPLNERGDPTDIQGILTVQDTNTWKLDQDGNQILQQAFTGMAELTEFRASTIQELASQFYSQGQISSYANSGDFFSRTDNLYTHANAGVIDSEWMAEQRTAQIAEHLAGATSDVYIVDLEKNVPQRIRMFIWLEAEDVDCGFDAQETSFALRIELAGGSDVD